MSTNQYDAVVIGAGRAARSPEREPTTRRRHGLRNDERELAIR